MAEHVSALGINTLRSQVLSVAELSGGFYLSAGNEVLSVKSVILATGVVQTSFYPGETEYLGRGVSYCATCDGMLYRGRKTAVIGLRSDAVEEANQLKEIGCEVTLIMPGGTPDDLKPGVDFISGKKFEFKGEQVLRKLIVDGRDMPDERALLIVRLPRLPICSARLSVRTDILRKRRKKETNIEACLPRVTVRAALSDYCRRRGAQDS
jgi:thioredoxin reductase (NADPH)